MEKDKEWFAIYFPSDGTYDIVNIKNWSSDKLSIWKDQCEIKIGKAWLTGTIVARDFKKAACEEQAVKYMDSIAKGRTF